LLVIFAPEKLTELKLAKFPLCLEKKLFIKFFPERLKIFFYSLIPVNNILYLAEPFYFLVRNRPILPKIRRPERRLDLLYFFSLVSEVKAAPPSGASLLQIL